MLKIPEKIEYVINTLLKNWYEAYIVGGCVRDMLLGKTPFDFDVTTSATPEEVMNLFEKTVPTGIKHGTVTVIIEKEPIEVTTFRSESEYNDNRHPESVSFIKNIEGDLSRRDFTVNALAFNNSKGIIDCYGGIKDLENRILRAVGEPQKRFSEDALRILRLFRFASTLEFTCEEETLNWALRLSHNLENISRERIFTELKKSVSGKNFKIFEHLINANGLEFLGINQIPDFEVVKKCRHNPNLALFAFLYLCKSDVLKVLNELKTSNNIKKYCETLLKLLDLPYSETKAELKNLLCISSYEILNDYLDFKNFAFGVNTEIQKTLLEEIITQKEPYLISHLEINGEILKNLGITGKRSGNILKLLQKEVILNPKNNTKEKLMEYIKENFL